jgi:hypothetical protein
LADVQRADAAVAAYVATNGAPDFLVMPTLQDVELIYYLRSVLVQFHRASPDGPSVMGELTPLPGSVLVNLPQSLLAGTPARDASEVVGANCWTVSVGHLGCRTCCTGVPTSCVCSCRPAKQQESRSPQPVTSFQPASGS